MKQEHGLWLMSGLALIVGVFWIVLALKPVTEGAALSKDAFQQTLNSVEGKQLLTQQIEFIFKDPSFEVKVPNENTLKEDVQACVFPGNTDEAKLKQWDDQKEVLEDKYLEANLDLELAMLRELDILPAVKNIDTVTRELTNHVLGSNFDDSKFPMPVGASMQAVLSSPVIITCDMSKKSDDRIEHPVERIKKHILENPVLGGKVEEIRKIKLNKGELANLIEMDLVNVYRKIATDTKEIYKRELTLLKK